MADKDEGSPEIGVGVLLAELFHGGLEGGGHVAGIDVSLIERPHEVGSAAVVDVPEGEKQGCRSGAEEATLKAEQFVSGSDKIHAGGAAAERDVPGGKTHLIEVIEVEVAVAEADAREHGVVLAVGAVRGDMKESALGPLFSEGVCSGLVTEQEICLRKDCGDGLNFGQDLRGALVGNTHHQGGGRATRPLLLAEGKDGGAGSVGNSVGIAEIGVAVLEGMKGKEVEGAVGHEDEVLCIQMRKERGN